MIDPIQTQALRTCQGAFRTSPVESLQVEANEPPLYIRRKKLSLQYAIKVLSNPKNPTYKSIFDPQYEPLFIRKSFAIPPLSIRLQPFFNAIEANTFTVADFQLPTIPPWLLNIPKVSFDLHTCNKSD